MSLARPGTVYGDRGNAFSELWVEGKATQGSLSSVVRAMVL